MPYCPYCTRFLPATRCDVPGCGGNICETCGLCHREETFHRQAVAAIGRVIAQDAG